MRRRNVTRKLFALLLAGALVLGLSGVTAFAAEAEPVSSTFTFTNQGVTEKEPGTPGTPDTTDEGGGIETPGTGETEEPGTTGDVEDTLAGEESEAGETGGTTAAKTADVNTGVYTVSALAAAAALIALMGVTVSRRRRYGKEGR